MKNLSVLSLILLLIFASESSYSKDNDGGLDLRAGLDIALGTMENKDKSIPSRKMNGVAAELMGGWIFKYVGPALYGEYRYTGQSDDPAEKSNQNMRGSGYLLGLGALGVYESFSLGIFYDFYGKYTLANKDANGKVADYSYPGGFNLVFGYEVMPQVSVNLVFGMVSYSKSGLDGTNSDIASNKMTHSWYGVGAMYHIF